MNFLSFTCMFGTAHTCVLVDIQSLAVDSVLQPCAPMSRRAFTVRPTVVVVTITIVSTTLVVVIIHLLYYHRYHCYYYYFYLLVLVLLLLLIITDRQVTLDLKPQTLNPRS